MYKQYLLSVRSLLAHPEICAAVQKFKNTPKFNAVRVKMNYIANNAAWNGCETYMKEKKKVFGEREKVMMANTLTWTYV